MQFLYRLVANIRDSRETTDGRVSFAYVFSDEQCNVSQAVCGEHKRIGTSKKYTVNSWLESMDYF